MPAAVPLPSLDPCHFLREVKLYFCSADLKWAGRGRERDSYLSSSEIQWLIPRLLKGQTFMLINVNALSSESQATHSLSLTFPISQ